MECAIQELQSSQQQQHQKQLNSNIHQQLKQYQQKQQQQSASSFLFSNQEQSQHHPNHSQSILGSNGDNVTGINRLGEFVVAGGIGEGERVGIGGNVAIIMDNNNHQSSSNRCNLNNKNSNLKHNHSALVKILESAPIHNSSKNNNNNNSKCRINNNNNGNISYNGSNILCVVVNNDRISIDQQSSITPPSDNINKNCDNKSDIKLMETSTTKATAIETPAVPEITAGTTTISSNSFILKNSSPKIDFCPWQKTRIAREWCITRNNVENQQSTIATTPSVLASTENNQEKIKDDFTTMSDGQGVVIEDQPMEVTIIDTPPTPPPSLSSNDDTQRLTEKDEQFDYNYCEHHQLNWHNHRKSHRHHHQHRRGTAVTSADYSSSTSSSNENSLCPNDSGCDEDNDENYDLVDDNHQNKDLLYDDIDADAEEADECDEEADNDSSDNINELCQKFEKNMSENKDVGSLFTFFCSYMFFRITK